MSHWQASSSAHQRLCNEATRLGATVPLLGTLVVAAGPVRRRADPSQRAWSEPLWRSHPGQTLMLQTVALNADIHIENMPLTLTHIRCNFNTPSCLDRSRRAARQPTPQPHTSHSCRPQRALMYTHADRSGLWNCGLLWQSRRFAPRGTCAGPPLWLGEKGSLSGARFAPGGGRRSPSPERGRPQRAGANCNRSRC